MTQDKVTLVNELMSQMDASLQDYVIDMLRHLKFAQNTLRDRNVISVNRNSLKK